MPFFQDRLDAGKQLAEKIRGTVGKDTVVLAIPRGGVVVGSVVADAFHILLDIIVPRKIGAPDNPELAIGAVTEDGTVILDKNLVRQLNVSQRYIREESERQKQEIKRRMRLYRGDMSYPNLVGRDVIIVDDGIATGSTMKAALASMRKKGAKTITIAVPVGPPSTIAELKKQADRVVCLETPELFFAIGQFYQNFDQTTDEEVITLLKLNRESLTGNSQVEEAS